MADVDREALPTVAEARDSQRATIAREAEQTPADQFAPAATATFAPSAIDQAPAEVAAERVAGNDNSPLAHDTADEAADMGTVADKALAGAAKGAIVVLDFVGKQVGVLVDFVASMLDGGDQSDNAAKRSQVEQFRAQKRALAAMEDMPPQDPPSDPPPFSP